MHLKKLYFKTIEPLTFEARLNKAVEDCESILDLGCGWKPHKAFSAKYSVGVDAFQKSIDRARKIGIYDKFYCIDVLKADEYFEANSFDCVVALDLIEHLNFEDGKKLLQVMEKLAKKRIIIFTTNGFLPQGEYDNNPWQIHRSGWSVGDMERMGFIVYGINGFKGIMGEECRFRLKPVFFWRLVRDFSNIVVFNHPKFAYQILCVKILKEGIE